MRRFLILIPAAVGLAIASRRSLADPRSHGFPRFFGFGALLGLVLLNAPWWFRRPFCPRQLASWTLLASSAGLAAHSFRALRMAGRPDERRADDPALLGFERTTALVRTGAYGVIRHPLYASLILLAGGALLKRVSCSASALAAGASACFAATALVEEAENLRSFGEEYAVYQRTTHLLIPHLL